jgi:CubicO group peptidase (beta-lactamase class C family)
MDRWLGAALDYIPRWLEYQMRTSELPGCAVAVVHRGQVVLDEAFGHADLGRGIPLTPRHRFRVASHSKSFTAAGIMKLRERGEMKLDDRAGQYVRGLHPEVAKTTIAQLLSHSAGLVRDGADSSQWLNRRPFLNQRELMADLSAAPTIDPNTRFKYSNHGYGLAGMVIEAVTDEPYAAWIKREIVEMAGLEETLPDVPLPRGTPLARGHSAKVPLGRRVTFAGDQSTHALAAATGFVSTAADLARFFNQLAPAAKRCPISAASRREMVRRQWRLPHVSFEQHYGLGTASGTLGDWNWFGHGGGFPGYITRTVTVPAQQLSLSVLTNSTDGLAGFWVDGALQVLRSFAKNGAPARRLTDWSGRWWTHAGATDLVPVGGKVLVATPALFNPFMDASEIEVLRRDRGRIALAAGYASHGEPAQLVRNKAGRVVEVKLAGATLWPEARVAKEMSARYGRR